MTNLTLTCRCGKLHGEITDTEHRSGERVRCFCRDCQSYAHHLGAADITLDEHGGTGMYLTTPKGIRFDRGGDQLACLQLSPKGPLRWYAQCCNTPIANVIRDPKLPFVSLPLAGISGDVTAALGDRETGVFAKDAKGTPSGRNIHAGMSPLAGLRVAKRLLLGRLKGEHKVTPFFGPDGKPVVAPTILSREARAKALNMAGFATPS